MEHASFHLAQLQARQAAGSDRYLEFLQVPSLSAGLYMLPQGAQDRQKPHDRDELYYVLAGKARFQAGAGDHQVDQAVEAGSVLFVKAGVEHRFHAIAEDLSVLVFFSNFT